MCNTQLLKQGKSTWLGHNSNRNAAEAQLVVRLPATFNDRAPKVRTTYIDIPQCPNRFGVILSRPYWMWGAEMGANDQGVVIGCASVRTRLSRKYGKALLGQDLLRLALERALNAEDALSIITQLIVRYGQGGPSSYRSRAQGRDTSFTIADAKETWLLETSGHWWVAKRIQDVSVLSDSLTIADEYDLARPGIEDFARREGFCGRFQAFDFHRAFGAHDRYLSGFSSSPARRASSMHHLETQLHGNPEWSDMLAGLRLHQRERESYRQHGNADICMHAGGLLRPRQTCSSMLVKLKQNEHPLIALSATSAPCLSLFSPVDFNPQNDWYIFNKSTESNPAEARANSLWLQFESVHRRALLDKDFCSSLKRSRDSSESALLSAWQEGVDAKELNAMVASWHAEWLDASQADEIRWNHWIGYERFWKNC